ncbi:MAG: DUF3883 domain-containing protein [Candidatus Methanoperedens sp.]|nr:DUF3883 domain-containing protein [Candidatus Methanoperedens sp.]
MMQNINEINRLLLAISELSGHKNNAVPESAVIRQCRNIVLMGSLPDHKDTIDFCIELKIIRREKNRLKVEFLGRNLLDANPSKNYEFTENQKNLVAKEFILHKEFLKEISKIIIPFNANEERGTFVWSHSDGIPIEGNRDILNLMLQFGILEKDGFLLLVNQKYVSVIANLRGFETLSLKKLREILDKKIEVGNIAEDLIVLYERKRLESIEAIEESKLVKKISNLNVSAGYDIVSFDAKSSDLKYDRFIEAKGSSNNLISFDWSNNEMKVAKNLGQKYWIYFLGGVDLKKKSSIEHPTLFQDPIKTIIGNSDFDLEYSGLKVKYKKSLENGK